VGVQGSPCRGLGCPQILSTLIGEEGGCRGLPAGDLGVPKISLLFSLPVVALSVVITQNDKGQPGAPRLDFE
jgi:hypothetical protein